MTEPKLRSKNYLLMGWSTQIKNWLKKLLTFSFLFNKIFFDNLFKLFIYITGKMHWKRPFFFIIFCWLSLNSKKPLNSKTLKIQKRIVNLFLIPTNNQVSNHPKSKFRSVYRIVSSSSQAAPNECFYSNLKHPNVQNLFG